MLQQIGIVLVLESALAAGSKWGSWSEWSPCPVTCGGAGIQERTCYSSGSGVTEARSVTTKLAVQQCTENMTDSRPCRSKPCPVHGIWSHWTSWSSCPVTCGGGNHSKYRLCDNPSPSNGGNHCEGLLQEMQTCNPHKCSGSWTTWSTWSDCQCNTGNQTRYRTCLKKGLLAADTCNGNSLVKRICESTKCLTPKPVYGARPGTWVSWTVFIGGVVLGIALTLAAVALRRRINRWRRRGSVGCKYRMRDSSVEFINSLSTAATLDSETSMVFSSGENSLTPTYLSLVADSVGYEVTNLNNNLETSRNNISYSHDESVTTGGNNRTTLVHITGGQSIARNQANKVSPENNRSQQQQTVTNQRINRIHQGHSITTQRSIMSPHGLNMTTPKNNVSKYENYKLSSSDNATAVSYVIGSVDTANPSGRFVYDYARDISAENESTPQSHLLSNYVNVHI